MSDPQSPDAPASKFIVTVEPAPDPAQASRWKSLMDNYAAKVKAEGPPKPIEEPKIRVNNSALGMVRG